MQQVSTIYDFPKLAGIYKFTNLQNNKIYIGETKNLKKRMHKYRHFRKDGRVHLISRAFQKYGFDKFKYEIIELFPLGTPKNTLLNREEFWIRIYNSTDKTIGYNILKRGKNMTPGRDLIRKGSYGMLGKKMSPEARKRISESNSGKNNWNYGKRGALHPNWGKKRNKEQFANLIKANSGPHYATRRPIYQIDPKTNEIIKEWSGAVDAVRHFGTTGISNALRRGNLSCGFKWEYVKPTSLRLESESQL